MKNSWIKTELGEHIETLKGFAFKSKWYQKTGVAVVRVSDFTENSISTQALNYISDEIANSYCRYKIYHHDVIVQTVGSWQSNPASVVGKVIHVPYNMEGALLNQNAVKIIPKASITQRFLYYLLKANNFRQHNLNYAQGAANQASITLDTIKRFKLNLPPLPIQQKIASILSAYDDLIENNIRRIELLEEQAQLIYEEWFVRMRFPNHENTLIDEETGLPEGWISKKLAEIAEINANSISSSFDEDIEYIDISSVSTKSIDHTTEYPIKEAPGRAKRIVTHGDIIWSCVRPNRKSYAVIWNPEENTIASTGFTVISPTEVPTSFLYQALGTEQFIAYLTNRATGAAYPAVKSIDFKEYDISLPPKSLIDKFDAQTKDYLDVIWNLKQQNQKLKEARDILLPRLMMGIIEV